MFHDHEGGDDRGPTVTIVKVNIFGGYTEASWEAPNITGKQGFKEIISFSFPVMTVFSHLQFHINKMHTLF